MTARLKELLARHYPFCGRVSSLTRSRAAASNEHFVARAARGTFFIKQVRDADALYGRGGIARLETVSRAVAALGDAGLPVERLVPTASGAPLVSSSRSVLRVYRFIEGRPYGGSAAELRGAASALGRLHAEGARSLSPALRRRIEALESPYPLCETAADLDGLERWLHGRPAYAALRRAFPLVRETAVWPATLKSAPLVLAHNDFHPGNILYGPGGAPVLIDLDSLSLAPARKCAALAVLRFAVRRPSDRRPRVLRKTLAAWGPAYRAAGGVALGTELYAWMACVELEKTLRIVARVRETGSYRSFLKNIPARHLPNLALAASLARR